jgi:hypothetical protein
MYTEVELREALRSLESTLQKCEKVFTETKAGIRPVHAPDASHEGVDDCKRPDRSGIGTWFSGCKVKWIF